MPQSAQRPGWPPGIPLAQVLLHRSPCCKPHPHLPATSSPLAPPMLPPPAAPRWKLLQELQDRNETLFYRILYEHFTVRGVWGKRGEQSTSNARRGGGLRGAGAPYTLHTAHCGLVLIALLCHMLCTLLNRILLHTAPWPRGIARRPELRPGVQGVWFGPWARLTDRACRTRHTCACRRWRPSSTRPPWVGCASTTTSCTAAHVACTSARWTGGTWCGGGGVCRKEGLWLAIGQVVVVASQIAGQRLAYRPACRRMDPRSIVRRGCGGWQVRVVQCH